VDLPTSLSTELADPPEPVSEEVDVSEERFKKVESSVEESLE
jgi:hypothetical protein